LERSPLRRRPSTYGGTTSDRILIDRELVGVIRGARQPGGRYGAIVEVLALTGQRRDEVAQMSWNEVDLGGGIWALPPGRTKNGKAHIVHLLDSVGAVSALNHAPAGSCSRGTASPNRDFSSRKRGLDDLCGVSHWRLHDLRRTMVSGMASLGVAAQVADKILNHVGGTISGVAAVYQRHEFLNERRDALAAARVVGLFREAKWSNSRPPRETFADPLTSAGDCTARRAAPSF
jgi:integrase